MKIFLKTFLFTLITAGIAILCSPSFAKIHNISVESPGNFKSISDIRKIENEDTLILKGKLNNDDISYLRYICGGDTALQPTGRRLGLIDMSDVSFDISGDPFLRFSNGVKYQVSSQHSLPDAIFAMCDVDRVIMPERLDSIGNFAFQEASIKSISIPENVTIGNYILYGDTLLSDLEWSDYPGMRLSDYNLKGLRKVKINNSDYLPGGFAWNLPEIEEIEINGPIMHFDGSFVLNCPKLKKITFNGPILGSSSQLAHNCPVLEEVVFNGSVLYLPEYIVSECPAFEGVRVNAPVFHSFSSGITADSAGYLGMPNAKLFVREMMSRCERYNNNNSDFKPIIALNSLEAVRKIAKLLDFNREVEVCDSIMEEMRNLDVNISKLELLKRSAPYQSGAPDVEIRYVSPNDSLLTLSRERFNLDSIAGKGDDLSKMKNLLYWIHDLIRHDGSSDWPQCGLNLREMYDICQKEERGLNCRLLAMGLTEALLAEGIPARYITCQSKAWASDSDCHVICVAWNRQLDKWIWLDPTFAAFVTDENDTPLHPGEVRLRLQKDLPLILNEDANWNHQSQQTVDHYLNEYMAKNLYIMSCNTLNQAEPEGKSLHQQGKSVALVPVGSDFSQAHILTNDDEWFWRSPERYGEEYPMIISEEK